MAGDSGSGMGTGAGWRLSVASLHRPEGQRVPALRSFPTRRLEILVLVGHALADRQVDARAVSALRGHGGSGPWPRRPAGSALRAPMPGVMAPKEYTTLEPEPGQGSRARRRKP